MKKKIDALAYSSEIAQALKKAAFVTTKRGDKVNTMAIGWGHIGRIWERPVFVAYVRDCRYTREMLDANPEFTVNVPVNGYDKRALAVCGGKSGRDTDKITEAGLTLVEPEVVSVPAIREFPLTLDQGIPAYFRMPSTVSRRAGCLQIAGGYPQTVLCNRDGGSHRLLRRDRSCIYDRGVTKRGMIR